MRTVLLIGNCGSGKTWCMLRLIEMFKEPVKAKCGMFRFVLDKPSNTCILGKYDGGTFQGSDRLSMAVMKDCEQFKSVQQSTGMRVICEGDRFTNSTFIAQFNPTIVKIKDDGSRGRLLRGSSQTERHIKSIATRVQNIKPDIEVNSSSEALTLIQKML